MRIVSYASEEPRSLEALRTMGHEVIDVTGRSIDEILALEPNVAVSLNGWYDVSPTAGGVLTDLYRRGVSILTSGNDTSNRELPILITDGFRAILTREEGTLTLLSHYLTEGVPPVNVGEDMRFNITDVTDGTEVLAYSAKGTLELLAREDTLPDGRHVRWVHFHPRWWFEDIRLLKNSLDWLTFKPYWQKWAEENLIPLAGAVAVGAIAPIAAYIAQRK